MANVNYQAVEDALLQQLMFIKSLDTDNNLDISNEETKHNVILSLFCGIFEGIMSELNSEHKGTFFESSHDTCLTIIKELVGEEVKEDIEVENKKLLQIMAWAYQAWLYNLGMLQAYDNCLAKLEAPQDDTEEVIEDVEETI